MSIKRGPGKSYSALESIMLTAVIEAHGGGRDVMTVDIPNKFIQTEMPEREEGEE